MEHIINFRSFNFMKVYLIKSDKRKFDINDIILVGKREDAERIISVNDKFYYEVVEVLNTIEVDKLYEELLSNG